MLITTEIEAKDEQQAKRIADADADKMGCLRNYSIQDVEVARAGDDDLLKTRTPSASSSSTPIERRSERNR